MNLKQKWNLVKELTITGFKLRNEGTFLGFFWYLLNPLLMLLVLYFIFSSGIGSGIDNYALYILIGLIQWNFLRNATVDGMRSMIDRADMIRVLNFPKGTIVISSVLKSLISHFFEILIVFAFIAFSGIISATAAFFPILLILQILLMTGISLILSPLIVYFRDLENIWNFILTVGWFATPIFYSISSIPKFLQPLYILNPMTQLIDASRNVLIYNSMPSIYSLIYILLFSSVLIMVGMLVSRKMGPNIPELI